jgi:hypothetical protein
MCIQSTNLSNSRRVVTIHARRGFRIQVVNGRIDRPLSLKRGKKVFRYLTAQHIPNAGKLHRFLVEEIAAGRIEVIDHFQPPERLAA